jgi:hypothetical protein
MAMTGYADPVAFEGTRTDPLTKQLVSSRCWNGRHQDWRHGDVVHPACANAMCQCYCHPQEEAEAEEAQGGAAA